MSSFPTDPQKPRRPEESPADRLIVAIAFGVLLLLGVAGYFLLR